MGSGISGVAEAPSIVADAVDDHRLVAAVRRGDDRAFETLYSRYQRRIHAYVVGMVKDHGRAEDVTQEVFVSALRRMRATERPIAFKPWIYEIAKNACIDQFRRAKRTDEVSLEADDGLGPADYGKLVNRDPTPDHAVAVKEDLDSLRGAFGGLSDTHHEILVLRELEGFSYREIGERLNMSRPAVESTLFRARRRLTEEFDELVTGARCLRVQELIATASETLLGTRESRRLSRHISHCQPCRREAMAAGLDAAILTHVPLRRRAAAKVAGVLPFPLVVGRSRGGGGDAPSASLAGSTGGGWMAHVPLLSEHLSGGLGKLVTAAAVLVAGVGAAGVGTQVVGAEPDGTGSNRAAQERQAGPAGAAAERPTVRRTAEGTRAAAAKASGTTAARRSAAAKDRAVADTRSTGGTDRAASGPAGAGSLAGADGGGDAIERVDASVPATPTIPSVQAPTVPNAPVLPSGGPADNVGVPANPVTDAVGGAGGSIGGAVQGATGAVEDATGVKLP